MLTEQTGYVCGQNSRLNNQRRKTGFNDKHNAQFWLLQWILLALQAGVYQVASATSQGTYLKQRMEERWSQFMLAPTNPGRIMSVLWQTPYRYVTITAANYL
jgi:hypothetical protein